ncbi:MAG: peptidoglycan DD-metalloendopeptidase family protein [Lachnospiraceae bacterium]|nr:peptidoglycan DD-metalloendopeptidase family protein [Lachnospiraceae bacterium]
MFKKYTLAKKYITTACAVFLAFTSITAFAGSLQDAKNEKNQLELRKQEIEATLAGLESKKNDIESFVREVDAKQKEIEEKMELLDGKLTKAESDLASTKEELAKNKDDAAKQYEIMKRRVKYMYENGTRGYIDTLFDSDSMADFLNQTEYMSKIAAYDAKVLEKYNKACEEVAATESKIEKQIADMSVMQEELEVEKAANEKLAAEKVAQIEEYNRLIAEADEEKAAVLTKIDDKQDLIDKIEAEIRRKEEEERARKAEAERQRLSEETKANAEKLLNGGFIWPLDDYSRISSYFGYREEVMAGSGTFHSGIDIPAPQGTPIHAAASGTVAAAGWHWSMGNYVMVYHGGDIYTVYMHSSKLLVSEGDSVKQGDTVALVGTTGMSTGPHLHFSIKLNGNYVNPLNYVSY